MNSLCMARPRSATQITIRLPRPWTNTPRAITDEPNRDCVLLRHRLSISQLSHTGELFVHEYDNVVENPLSPTIPQKFIFAATFGREAPLSAGGRLNGDLWPAP